MPRARRFWDKPLSECPAYSEYHQHDGYFCLWKDRTQRQLRRWFGREFDIEQWPEVRDTPDYAEFHRSQIRAVQSTPLLSSAGGAIPRCSCSTPFSTQRRSSVGIRSRPW